MELRLACRRRFCESCVDVTETEPFEQTILWLYRHAGFPARRLDSGAEIMLCVAALAAAENAPGQGAGFHVQRRDGAADSAQRTHALRRSRVHFKCDNSAKV